MVENFQIKFISFILVISHTLHFTLKETLENGERCYEQMRSVVHAYFAK